VKIGGKSIIIPLDKNIALRYIIIDYR